jgi:hypothetical protein
MSVDKFVDLGSTSKKGGAEMRQLRHLKFYLSHEIEDPGTSGPRLLPMDFTAAVGMKSAPALLTILKH